MPHHAVVREDKVTTKLRIIYDASAKASGPSLNDCIYTRPKFNQSILDIILRFLTHRIALVADIEKASLMISVAEPDRDALRFLWVDDIGSEFSKTVVMRFAHVAFGVSSSPFLLNATIRHHLEQYAGARPRFVKKFLRSIYVDDLSFGAEDSDDAFELFQTSKKLLAEGGFNLRKFITNSKSLQERIDQSELALSSMRKTEDGISAGIEEDESYAKDALGSALVCGEHKVLGVSWTPEEDQLVFDLSGMATLVREQKPTKRNIVGLATRFYDPLGFVSPVTVQFKMLFQELCSSKIDWDEPLSGDLLHKWNVLTSSFQGVSISIPRCYFNSVGREFSTCSLQGFCDASTIGHTQLLST